MEDYNLDFTEIVHVLLYMTRQCNREKLKEVRFSLDRKHGSFK